MAELSDYRREVFSLPGLGYLIIDSVLYRDSPVIPRNNPFLAFRGDFLTFSPDLLQRLLQQGETSRGTE